jgi:hypothetical protein
MKDFFNPRKLEDDWVDPEHQNVEQPLAELKNQFRETHQQLLWDTGLAARAHQHVARYQSRCPSADMCRYDVEVHVGDDSHPYEEAINIRVLWEGGSGLGGEDLTVWRVHSEFVPYQQGSLARSEVDLVGILSKEVKLIAEEPDDGVYSLANKAAE